MKRWILSAVAAIVTGLCIVSVGGFDLPFDVQPPKVKALRGFQQAGGDGLIRLGEVEFNTFYWDPRTNARLKPDAEQRAAIDRELTQRGFTRDREWRGTAYKRFSFDPYPRRDYVAILEDGTIYCMATRSQWPFIIAVSLFVGMFVNVVIWARGRRDRKRRKLIND